MNRKTMMKPTHYILLALAPMLAACATESTGAGDQGLVRINLEAGMGQTRAGDNDFADGDVMGVYVVDYDGATPGTLKASGNHADNVRHTLDKASGKWRPAYDLYWYDNHTHIDVYAYYPYGTPTDVGNYQFEVTRDQSTASNGNGMGGYEASDLLWGKVADVAPTTATIRLPMSHRMACAHITLEKGSGFGAGEWELAEKNVLAANLVRKASVNMADGSVRPAGGVEPTATIPARNGNEWRLIAVPQTVKGGTALFSITIGGQAFKFSRPDDFTYAAGKMSNFTIRVDKRLPEGTYRLTLAEESITPWENDLTSHDATARGYLIIRSTPGHLKDSIAAANKDYTKVKSLKVTGGIDGSDLVFMRLDMTNLQAVNLKEARIRYHKSQPELMGRNPQSEEDELPNAAFADNLVLTHVILPDTLKKIGSAFANCPSLTGSTIMPEGVTDIGASAFLDCHNLNNFLPLPSTLKSIGAQAFLRCNGVSGHLVLPDQLETIGDWAFKGCTRLYGELRLPATLKAIGGDAFRDCSGLTGSLAIPQNVSIIYGGTFANCGFDGTLTLHDGILFIGEDAFQGDSKLKGTVTIPSSLAVVNFEVFNGCEQIEKLVLPRSIEHIGDGAFGGCYGLKTIVSHNDTPPETSTTAFDGVDKETAIVYVPRTSVNAYKEADGWKDFKNITAIEK